MKMMVVELDMLTSTIDVTADSTLVVLDKTTSLYLEEDKSIVVTASTLVVT